MTPYSYVVSFDMAMAMDIVHRTRAFFSKTLFLRYDYGIDFSLSSIRKLKMLKVFFCFKFFLESLLQIIEVLFGYV
jgi:hypothetical protein